MIYTYSCCWILEVENLGFDSVAVGEVEDLGFDSVAVGEVEDLGFDSVAVGDKNSRRGTSKICPNIFSRSRI